MNLVIVESPTKAKTIDKFLSRNYKVLSSYGHVRDLPKGKFGVDIEDNFKPSYVIPIRARKTIQLLKKEAQGAQVVILATDEDREGEAIAWHLIQALGLNELKTQNEKIKIARIVFHEITKPAIEEALKNPRDIDTCLVNAQQARRILDRIVGYKLSPFLWKKVARGLSAGRVQSVAVRLVAEREREIQNFIPQEYWTIEALFQKTRDAQTEFLALLIKKGDEIIPKLGIKNKNEAEKIIKDLEGAGYEVSATGKREVKKNPVPPFTTSTLQQEAWKRFRFPAKLTMKIAQDLYERGLTTYHRTDSLNLADLALFAAKKFIIETYGQEYWAGFPKRYKAKGLVQEAHEAIRPTYPDQTPEKLKLKKKLDEKQLRLYDLIWRRFIACQMAQAVFISTTADINAAGALNYTFRATGSTLKFDGFIRVYPVKFEETELPPLEKGEALKLIKLNPGQHFTQPPPRYSEATLIKTLEENGIGRPSTYASIISTIQERNYIEKDEVKKFKPTEIGRVVNDLLVQHFPQTVDIQFTARMEQDLDKVAAGQTEWVKVLKEFYAPFDQNLQLKYQEISKRDIAEEVTNKTCPKCAAPLLIKLGRFGKFYACSQFPKCKYTESLKENLLGVKCPKCQKGEIVEKRTRPRKGPGFKTPGRKLFYGCNRFPECDFALWDKPTGEICPACHSSMVETRSKRIRCSNKNCLQKN